MSEEEIRKALEIIKQPIKVNCIEYKYFDQENYDNLIRVYENCLWIVNLFEQAKEHIEPIQQENTKLKSVLKEIRKYIKDNISQEFRNGRSNEFYLELNEKKLKILLEIIDKGIKEDE